MNAGLILTFAALVAVCSGARAETRIDDHILMSLKKRPLAPSVEALNFTELFKKTTLDAIDFIAKPDAILNLPSDATLQKKVQSIVSAKFPMSKLPASQVTAEQLRDVISAGISLTETEWMLLLDETLGDQIRREAKFRDRLSTEMRRLIQASESAKRDADKAEAKLKAEKEAFLKSLTEGKGKP